MRARRNAISRIIARYGQNNTAGPHIGPWVQRSQRSGGTSSSTRALTASAPTDTAGLVKDVPSPRGCCHDTSTFCVPGRSVAVSERSSRWIGRACPSMESDCTRASDGSVQLWGPPLLVRTRVSSRARSNRLPGVKTSLALSMVVERPSVASGRTNPIVSSSPGHGRNEGSQRPSRRWDVGAIPVGSHRQIGTAPQNPGLRPPHPRGRGQGEVGPRCEHRRPRNIFLTSSEADHDVVVLHQKIGFGDRFAGQKRERGPAPDRPPLSIGGPRTAGSIGPRSAGRV